MSTIETRLYINNTYTAAKAGDTFPIFNPFDGSHVADVCSAGEDDVEAAVIAAERAQQKWAALAGTERAAIMRRFAELLRQHARMIAELDAQVMGRPAQGNTEGAGSAAIFDYYAGLGEHVHGTSSLLTPGFINVSIKQPFGVTVGIIPWNFPLGSFAFKAAPAVAAGNAIIIKTSEKAPLSLAYISEYIEKAGFPPGIIQILHGAGKTGQLLSEHMRVRKISFTGSTQTGRAILIASAKSNMKNVTLELGGKSPTIIFDDADIDKAASSCAFSIGFNSGQVCIASSRLYVHEQIHDRFVQALGQAMIQFRHGDPLDAGTTMGPQADKAQSTTVAKYMGVGKEDGVVAHGGQSTKENFFEPTIFTDIPHSSRLNREEVFGPVVVVHRFVDEDEAIKLCNESEYGLYAAVFTRNVDRALRVAKRLESGSVGVNCNSPMTANDLPFGGWKMSGMGRENGPNGLAPWLEDKSMYIKVNGI
ncbi:hypothetical protein I302_107929 [Kwoniella bestiolae CBS 10118]|uniref:Aldehyde dehydrogenase domain-containing protein n=1 Tax=Kwoniella bestiolae CBS 10118 TaxID=1296100 RepID=A0A1B9FX51_9TREE|nr:hypothetical protein I302_07707 [Kwoniella bestiolae CBS 10118]OCF23353.1 hypothetical protein I302_07707 [Kwoniella bestiolae CBS 10118]